MAQYFREAIDRLFGLQVWDRLGHHGCAVADGSSSAHLAELVAENVAHPEEQVASCFLGLPKLARSMCLIPARLTLLHYNLTFLSHNLKRTYNGPLLFQGHEKGRMVMPHQDIVSEVCGSKNLIVLPHCLCRWRVGRMHRLSEGGEAKDEDPSSGPGPPVITADGGKLTSRGKAATAKTADKEPMLCPGGQTSSASP